MQFRNIMVRVLNMCNYVHLRCTSYNTVQKVNSVNSRLFGSLMVEGQKDFLSLVLLFRLLYFLPEGRRVNGPCWGGVGSLMLVEALMVELLVHPVMQLVRIDSTTQLLKTL